MFHQNPSNHKLWNVIRAKITFQVDKNKIPAILLRKTLSFKVIAQLVEDFGQPTMKQSNKILSNTVH